MDKIRIWQQRYSTVYREEEREQRGRMITVSPFEIAIEEILIKNFREVRFNHPGPVYGLIEQDGKRVTFRPDFLLLDMTINGKRVALEPHSWKYTNANFLDKLNAAMHDRKFSSEIHLVLITDMDAKPFEDKLRSYLLEKRDACNELWVKKRRAQNSSESSQTFREGLTPKKDC